MSLWQPWASLIALGVKTVETRSWATKYRGRLAIHAAKTPKGVLALPGDCEGKTEAGWVYGYIGDYQALYCTRTSDEGTRGQTQLVSLGPAEVPIEIEDEDQAMPLGALVATCQLVECVRTHNITWVPDWGLAGGRRWGVGERCAVVADKELRYGDYTPFRWAWLLNDVRALAEPIPCRGRQGLWTLPDEALAT